MWAWVICWFLFLSHWKSLHDDDSYIRHSETHARILSTISAVRVTIYAHLCTFTGYSGNICCTLAQFHASISTICVLMINCFVYSVLYFVSSPVLLLCNYQAQKTAMTIVDPQLKKQQTFHYAKVSKLHLIPFIFTMSLFESISDIQLGSVRTL